MVNGGIFPLPVFHGERIPAGEVRGGDAVAGGQPKRNEKSA